MVYNYHKMQERDQNCYKRNFIKIIRAVTKEADVDHIFESLLQKTDNIDDVGYCTKDINAEGQHGEKQPLENI